MSEIEQFKILKSDIERLNFVENSSKFISKQFKNESFAEKRKDITYAQKNRNVGNDHFKNGRFIAATRAYTQSLFDSPLKTVEYQLALGNRSASLFRLELYEQCIKDINMLVKLSGVKNDEKLMKALIRRCWAKLKLNTCDELKDDLSFIRKKLPDYKGCQNSKEKFLSELNVINTSIKQKTQIEDNKRPKNMCYITGADTTLTSRSSVLLNASSKVGVKVNTIEGRHLVAKGIIPRGEIIIKDRPYCNVLSQDFFTVRCYHCYEEVFSLIPCLSCTLVGFCSVTCRENALSRYHQYECRHMNSIVNTGLGALAYRIVSITPLDIIIGTFINDVEKKIDRNNFENVYDSANYLSVYNLMLHSDKENVQDLLGYTYSSCILMRCLIDSIYFDSSESIACNLMGFTSSVPDLFLGVKTKKKVMERIVGSHILRHIQQLICNSHSMSDISCYAVQKVSKEVLSMEEVDFGSAVYPTVALMNHSCVPNIQTCPDRTGSGDLIIRAACHIEKGEKICNSYGPTAKKMNKIERKQDLMQQYQFDCKCSACKNWKINNEHIALKCVKCLNGRLIHNDTLEKGFCLDCDFKPDEEFLKKCKVKITRGQVLHKEGDRLYSSGHIDKCVEKYQECINLYKEFSHPTHSLILGSLYDKASVSLISMGQYRSPLMKEYLNNSIEITKNVYGDKSVEFVNELLKQATVCQTLGDLAQAIENLEQCINISQLYHQTDSKFLIHLQNTLKSYKKMKDDLE